MRAATDYYKDTKSHTLHVHCRVAAAKRLDTGEHALARTLIPFAKAHSRSAADRLGRFAAAQQVGTATRTKGRADEAPKVDANALTSKEAGCQTNCSAQFGFFSASPVFRRAARCLRRLVYSSLCPTALIIMASTKYSNNSRSVYGSHRIDPDHLSDGEPFDETPETHEKSNDTYST